jgi:glycosyltransferase involved in cell wall biosynthesis
VTDFLTEIADVTVVALSATKPSGQISHTQERAKLVIRMGKAGNRAGTMSELRDLVTTLDNERPFDLFHGFFLPAADAFLDIAGHRPTIASIRGNDAVRWLETPRERAIIAKIVSHSTLVTSVSADLLDKVSCWSRDPATLHLIHNSIALHTSSARWYLSDMTRGRVGTVANFRAKKNIPLLMQAFACIPSEFTKRLSLCGSFDLEPSLEASLQALGMRLGIWERVEFTGALEPGRAVEAQLLNMHVFVISSNHDGLPNSLLEAAVLGVPIVSTNVGGMRDVIKSGVNGLLVPPGDPEAMAEAIGTVLGNDTLAQSLSQGALELAAAHAPTNEKRRWHALYEEVLQ